MKAIVKIAALAMTLALAFVLTACGGSASSSAASSSGSASASAASASAASSPAASAAASSASASAASESASSASAIADADTYKNEYFGIQFDLPEGWAFVDVSTFSSTSGPLASAAENASLDMIAGTPDGSNMVVVGIEEPNDTTAGKTAEEILAAQVQKMTETLEGNFNYTSTDATITFNGLNREIPANITDLTINDAHLFLCQAVAEKDGAFLNIVTMGTSEEDATNVISHFKALSE